MIINPKSDRALTEKRKELITLLQKEGYLRSDHDFDCVKFILNQTSKMGVELELSLELDTLNLDLIVPYGDQSRDDAFDHCSGVANQILDERTEANRFDYNDLHDALIFHYGIDLKKHGPDDVIKQLRRAVEAC